MPFETLSEGQRFTHRVVVTAELIDRYAQLSGDISPIHVSDQAAAQLGLPSRIAHGNILGMMVSTLVGTGLPDPGVMLVSQKLDFRRPVLAGREVTLTATLDTKSEAVRIIELKLDFSDGLPGPVATGRCSVRWLQ